MVLLDLVMPDLEALMCSCLLYYCQGNCISCRLHCCDKAAPVTYCRADFPGNRVDMRTAEERHAMAEPERCKHLPEHRFMHGKRARGVIVAEEMHRSVHTLA